MALTRLAERDESDTAPRRRAPRRPGGWLPGGLVLTASAGVLHAYGVSLVTTGVFGLYVALVIALPGMLLWRLLRRGPLAEDLAIGAAVGYGVEILAYVPARALGVPLAALAVPIGILATFALVPALRPNWRSVGRPPAGWSWTLAGIALVLLFWSTVYYRHHGFGWPSYGRPDIDLPFHLALVGELKHHMDLVTPWVVSEPVYYHWFVYADMAATSWTTRIEPYVLVTRLSMLPVIFATAVAVAALGRRVVGSWRAGALTALATCFVLAPDPYGWVQDLFYRDYGFNPVDDGSDIRLTLWTSPTQTFGSLLFVPLMLVLLDVLRAHSVPRRTWIALAVLPAAVMGAKASFLPTLLCALLLVSAVHLVLHRRVHRRAAVALAIVLGWMVFAQLVLFGGESQGLGLGPLDALRRNPAGVSTHYTQDPRWYRLVILLAITLLGWTAMWCGAAGLGLRRLLRPDAVLLAGLPLAGFGVLLLFGHSGGQAEGFFLQGARPYAAALAMWGLLALLAARTRPPRTRPPHTHPELRPARDDAAPLGDGAAMRLGGGSVSSRRVVRWFGGGSVSSRRAVAWFGGGSVELPRGSVSSGGSGSPFGGSGWRRGVAPVGAALGGAGLVYLVRLLDGGSVPIIGPSRHAAAVTVALVWPWVVLGVVALGAALIAWRARSAYGAGLVVALLLGCCAPTAVRQVSYAYADGRDNGWHDRADLWPVVTEGTLEAGRWLRDHSSPNDLVATNMHCAYEGRRGHSACDRRHFGIAAYSERRVLVESWAYTAEAHDQELTQGVPQEHTEYWLPHVLADNDAAFNEPSPETIGWLRDRYGVSWLFTEDDIMPPSPELPRYATLVFRSGHCAVYRIK